MYYVYMHRQYNQLLSSGFQSYTLQSSQSFMFMEPSTQ